MIAEAILIVVLTRDIWLYQITVLTAEVSI